MADSWTITIPKPSRPSWAGVRSLVVLGWLAALQAQIGGCSLPPIPWPTPTPSPAPVDPTPAPVPQLGPLWAVLVSDPATETPTQAALKTSVRLRAELPQLDATWATILTTEREATTPGMAKVLADHKPPLVAIYEAGKLPVRVVENPTEESVIEAVRGVRGQ
jgi:hypothetical protein